MAIRLGKKEKNNLEGDIERGFDRFVVNLN
jgi:hypothetical protein